MFFLGCTSKAVLRLFFSSHKEILKFLNIAPAELLSFSQFMKKTRKIGGFFYISLGCVCVCERERGGGGGGGDPIYD